MEVKDEWSKWGSGGFKTKFRASFNVVQRSREEKTWETSSAARHALSDVRQSQRDNL